MTCESIVFLSHCGPLIYRSRLSVLRFEHLYVIQSLSCSFLVRSRWSGQAKFAADLSVDTLHLLHFLLQLHASVLLRLKLPLEFAYIGLGGCSGDARLPAHVTCGRPKAKRFTYDLNSPKY